jgi:hypothetical protein
MLTHCLFVCLVSGHEFAALSLANGLLQALQPLKTDDEQPGDEEDGTEVHLVDQPSKKFKEQHASFQKKKPTPEAALVPNLLKLIVEMLQHQALYQRTILVLSSFIYIIYKVRYIRSWTGYGREFSTAGTRIKNVDRRKAWLDWCFVWSWSIRGIGDQVRRA